jgi:hypothetical protein
MKKLILMIFLLAPLLLSAKHLHKESWYQKGWCEANGGIVEYRLKDKTRVDCLTDEYAIEFDFAKKWAEGIGQSLYYAIQTKKRPAVALILEKQGDMRYYKRLLTVAQKHGIRLFIIDNRGRNLNYEQ